MNDKFERDFYPYDDDLDRDDSSRENNDNGVSPENSADSFEDFFRPEDDTEKAPSFAGRQADDEAQAEKNYVLESDAQNPQQDDGDVFIDGEYHFKSPDLDVPAYSDAGYVSSDRAAAVPPRYRCTERAPEKEKEPRRKTRRRPGHGISAAAVICMCLVCSLVGGLVGGAAIKFSDNPDAYISDSSGDGSGTVINYADDPTPSSSVTAKTVASGSEMTATEIYALGCEQSVAIKSEITYYNIFGQTTSAAVSGSGFVISSDGYIMTNYHVIEDADKGAYDITVVFYDGTECSATVVGYEKDNDVAILKIDATDLNAVTFGNSDLMQVGETVYAIGNPLGELAFTMTSGSISALDREISTSDSSTGTATTINMFQIDAAVNSGNSGGPVYNSRGEVIGIVTAKYSDSGVEGLGFAIPINDASSIAEDLITKGYVSGKASIGIYPQEITSYVAQYYNMPLGVYVTEVVSGSAAESCGIQVGDIITGLGDADISSYSELKSALKDYREGDTTTIRVYRSGEYLDLTITFDEYIPDDTTEDSDALLEEETGAAGNSMPQQGFPQQGGQQRP